MGVSSSMTAMRVVDTIDESPARLPGALIRMRGRPAQRPRTMSSPARPVLLGNRDSLALGLVAEGAAHRVVERLVGLRRVLLLLLLDVGVALLAEFDDLLLDRLALGRHLLDVGLALLRLQLLQLVTQF